MTNKQKILNMVQKLPDDVTIDDVLNRIVLLRKIDIAIGQCDRGEVMDHDEFFKQLEEEDEKESKTRVVGGGTKGSTRNKVVHRQAVAKNGSKIRQEN
jgi:hypothetical protein